MDEFDPDEAEQDEAPEGPAIEEAEGVDPKRLTKLQNENRSLRVRLRRTELQAKFGPDISELVPDTLPLKEWEAFAEKLQDFKGPAAQTDQTESVEVEAPVEEPSPAERQLAAVSRSSATGGPAASRMSAREWMDLNQKSPGEAMKLLRGGGVELEGPANPQTPLP